MYSAIAASFFARHAERTCRAGCPGAWGSVRLLTLVHVPKKKAWRTKIDPSSPFGKVLRLILEILRQMTRHAHYSNNKETLLRTAGWLRYQLLQSDSALLVPVHTPSRLSLLPAFTCYLATFIRLFTNLISTIDEQSRRIFCTKHIPPTRRALSRTMF